MALITPDDLRRVIGLLKATFTHLIIDLSKSYSPIDMVALEMANHILLVTQLDLPCLRNVVRLMMSFGQMDAIKDKVKIVVNRVGLDNQIGLKKAQETIGREIFWQLPNDYRVMVEVRNNGVPLIEQAPKAAITQSIIALADALLGDRRRGRSRRRSGPKDQPRVEFENIKRRIHGKLVDKLDLSRVGELEGDVLRREIRLVVEHLCDTEDTLLNRNERERLIDEVLDETFGLGPLEMLLKDPTISDILINGPKNVYVERRGKMEKTTVSFRDNKHLMQIIDRIVSKVGRRVDEVCPMVDARLPDGSRVNAIIPPLALDGPACRFAASAPIRSSSKTCSTTRAFTPEMVMLLEGAMKARLNIVISGGTGSGKTTLLNTLSSFISNDDRIVTIEDAAELQLAAGPRGAAGNAAAEHRRQGRDHGHRPGAQLPCVCGPSGSSSASAAVPKRSTCCRP